MQLRGRRWSAQLLMPSPWCWCWLCGHGPGRDWPGMVSAHQHPSLLPTQPEGSQNCCPSATPCLSFPAVPAAPGGWGVCAGPIPALEGAEDCPARGAHRAWLESPGLCWAQAALPWAGGARTWGQRCCCPGDTNSLLPCLPESRMCQQVLRCCSSSSSAPALCHCIFNILSPRSL